MEMYNVSGQGNGENHLIQGAGSNLPSTNPPLFEQVKAMYNEGAPDFVVDQGLYYPNSTNYGYYCTGLESPGEWEDHQRIFGADGPDTQYMGAQTETLPYVYYTPNYGYAQSPYNPYNPYIPGAMVGVDGSLVGTQQYYPVPPYQNNLSSPAYIPFIGQPDVISNNSDPLFEIGAAAANRQDGRGFKNNLASASTAFPRNPPKPVMSQTHSLSWASEGPSENEQHGSKQVEEASPEECDQAVEDLSMVKAKAKAKQMQDSQKSSTSIIQRVWAMLLGIGPALRAVASMNREDWANKIHHWKDAFKSTMQHYWLGTKLLWADVRISSRLLLKLASGKGLSRRERQQLTRTTADIFRLVPFAVFIIVPFMEFLLPVFLKLFPNMLPSTFQDKMKEEEELKRRLNARMEYAKFLQDTVKEMAKEVQDSRSGEIKKTAEDLDEFMNSVRTGTRVSNDEILGFAKLFNDELTLDNISRSRLVNMCKYMGISPYGTDAYLRYMLRKRLQEIKKDDKMIQAEGVESLSEAELRQACRDRGLLGLVSVEEMRQQLCDWLDLSLNHSVPSSLLILSRAFSVSGKIKPEEAVQATLSSLPDEVVETVSVTALPSEDLVSERRRKLEFLEMQEELIKEEEEEEEEEQAKMKESVSSQKDVALEEMIIPTAKEAQEKAKAKTLEQHEQLCELSRALAVLASASSVSRERQELLKLVRKEVDLYNSMVEKEGTEGEEEAKKAYIAAREDSDRGAVKAIGDKVSSALIDRVESMLQKLEKEIDEVDNKIGDRWRLLDRDKDGKVTPEEVASAAMYLKDTLCKEGFQELISNLSKDREGKILVRDIVKLGSETEDADITETEAGQAR